MTVEQFVKLLAQCPLNFDIQYGNEKIVGVNIVDKTETRLSDRTHAPTKEEKKIVYIITEPRR